MEKKENQRITLTKRLLKEALLQLMEGKRIGSITVSELCKLSGINRSTFYNHYGCPEDVLKDIETEFVADLDAICQRASAKGSWPMNQRVETLCSFLLERKQVAMLLLENCSIQSEFVARMLQATNVRAAYDPMLSRAGDPDSQKLMITFFSTGGYYMLRQWLLEDIPKTPKEMGALADMLATQSWTRPVE